MEREEDVEEKLGSQNVKLLLEAIKSGKLKEQKVKRISLKMHAHVHGVFVDKREQNNCELVDVMRNTLDQWALEELYKPEIDGLTRLVQILEDVEEFPLALKIKSGQYQRNEIADQTSSLAERLTGEEEPNRIVSSSSFNTPERNAEGVSTPSPAVEEGEQNRLITDCSVNIPDESVAPLCMPYTKLRSWKKTVCVSGLVLTLSAVLLVLLLKKPQTTGQLGVGGISGKSVAWIQSCPGDKYTASLSAMDRSIDNFGMIQVGDEIWACGGGDQDQTRSCEILSLKDGRWRPLEQKMNLPRIRPEMKVEGSKVFVQGGTTSDINSMTGCRNTQDVFDRENPTGGWVTEDMAETSSCLRSSKQEVWADHLVWVDC